MNLPEFASLEITETHGYDVPNFKQDVLHDLWLCTVSREASLSGRKEVLSGKAKFGIFGDGKELAQVAMARAFKKGDWRSGYYRDQTFMIARGLCSVEDFFAQLYADTNNDPFSGGRQMNNHFATPMIDKDGEWINQADNYNVSSDISPTAGQMARSLGLAMASKKYRKLDIPGKEFFSDNGNEISFVTIGDASTSEGVFWETINAASVMKVPLLVSVWDDGYGISVPVEMQTNKGSISKSLEGFLQDKDGNGILIYTVKAWDYPTLCAVYEKAAQKVREQHVPCLIHVLETTQPQGHSTSGSHERYKSPERLLWEKEYDCIQKMSEWIIKSDIASIEEVESVKKNAQEYTRIARENAWKAYRDGISVYLNQLKDIYQTVPDNHKTEAILSLEKQLTTTPNISYAEIISNARKFSIQLSRLNNTGNDTLNSFIADNLTYSKQKYNTHLFSETKYAALNIEGVPVKYGLEPENVPGYQVLNHYFDELLASNPYVIAFGEDVGQIGDVNQGFAGLQQKYGKERVFDTGIREWTIMGQALGGAMRGLRPIAEIQYLDYLAYAFSVLSDDLATLRYRSNGIQKAPAIIRTRGHRLEGIWHAGSPMGMLLTSMQGIYICVPRNMTQAVGFYNTLLQSDDPAIVIECLNGYRLREKLPQNLLEYSIPLGVPEILQEGHDVTLVTYGSCVREAQKGIDLLQGFNISVELIDVQTLLPFDKNGIILESIKKTNRVLFMDEDVPGGATAYMMREVLEKWDGYRYLDSKPATLSATSNRPPFGSDGDYFSKPNGEDVFDAVMKMMKEAYPDMYN
ncbi:MAG TPA: thiamine pyrophosphate-dependent enzyme [Saprospiraceae bacterium]|nr:transketolase [Saprospiraceae bacterium]HRO08863.1 thiamine pyrophosphate-dependent enzyme [Saprospiraceae bacterium]HRP42144.1 thiamine pyrophosphate-dependent enzyme [Saprospiraceae bacterium]